MASPPFSLSTLTPSDSDIVSQFPLNERTLRDIIQSWILANHDTNGNHPTIIAPFQSSAPATPASGFLAVYADVNGRMKYVRSDGSINFVGLPPGTVIYTASSTTPVGFLIPDASAVSRSTFADLFAQLGSTYGAGDGSTTFNLPDIKGRVIAGEDASGTRLSSTFFGGAATIAAVGGLDNVVMAAGNLILHNHSINDPGHIHQYEGHSTQGGGGTSVFIQQPTGTVNVSTTSNVTGISINNAGSASPTGMRVIQPTIILRALIKT